MTKLTAAERRVVRAGEKRLRDDAMILCTSLVLTEPHVNKRQIELCGKILRQIAMLQRPSRRRKAGK